MIVPCDHYERAFEPDEEVARFHALLGRTERLANTRPSQEAFLAAGHRVVDLSDRLIAIWVGQPARGKGGTADVVAYARRNHVRVNVVWP